MFSYTDDELTGACELCGGQFIGRAHVCRPAAVETPNNYHPLGAQFMYEFDAPQPRRRFGQRLEEGFELLVDSGWDDAY